MLVPPRRRTGPQYLPAAYYRAVAAGGAVVLPAGEFRLGSPLRTDRAVQITAPGGPCWLTPNGFAGLVIASPVAPYLTASQGTRNESKLTGTVTANTTTLTLAEPVTGLTAGEVVKLGLGVNLDDPAEYAATVTRTVAGFTGTSVTFTQPVGLDIPTYTDSELRSHFPDDRFWTEKIGTWGTWRDGTGQYRKGYGDIQGLLRSGGAGFITGASVDNVGFRQPNSAPVRRPLALETVRLENLSNTTLANLRFDGAAGAAVLVASCESLTVTNTQATGDAYYRYGDTAVTRAPVFQVFGGRLLTLSSTTVAGRNWQYVWTEVTPRNLTLAGATITSTAHSLTQDLTQLYVTGKAPGLAASGIQVAAGIDYSPPTRPAEMGPPEAIPAGAVTALPS